MKESKYVLKIIILGDTLSGKTTFVHRYVYNEFLESSHNTIGVEFSIKEPEIANLKCVLQLWDFGGEKRYRFLLNNYILGVKGLIFSIDLTKNISLQDISGWKSILNKVPSDVPKILIGTKSDLKEDIRISGEVIEELINEYNFFNYYEVSNKTGKNVNIVIETLVREILKKSNVIKQEEKEEDFKIIETFLNLYSTGYFALPVEDLGDYIRKKYKINISNDELIDLIENKFDGFSIGIDILKNPNNPIECSTVVPWNFIVFYINDKMRRLPKDQYDRIYFKDIRNSLYFPDHTQIGHEKAFKYLTKLICIVDECNNRGYFLRNVHITQDSIEIPALNNDNIEKNLSNLRKLIELNFKNYKKSFDIIVYDQLDMYFNSINKNLLELIHMHRDKILPELIEISSISQEEWNNMKDIYGKAKELWNKMKRKLRLEKVIILRFKCSNCGRSYRFVYLEKTKFHHFIKTIIKLAPWAKNLIEYHIKNKTLAIIITEKKPENKQKEISKRDISNLLPDEIAFLYQTLIGIESKKSQTLAETFNFSKKHNKYCCYNCIS